MLSTNKCAEGDQYSFNYVPKNLYYPPSPQGVSLSLIPIYIHTMTILALLGFKKGL
jgi:hypothetical protein